MGLKLGKRLAAIAAMVDDHYDHIWDCCCDHGLLGAALLSRQAAPPIYFVDIVPSLMAELEQKLARFFPPASPTVSARWQVQCMDVGEIYLQGMAGKHLVIIAGVGGDLMAALVLAIARNNPHANVDFLLCPVHHQFTLRQQLIQLDFGLQDETLMVENQRFYEILLVSSTSNTGKVISPVGSSIWMWQTAEQQTTATHYLAKTLAHYERMYAQKDNAKVQDIIDAYRAVVINPL